MKFTKEDAYKELVKQMTANGEKLNLSERSFNEQLEKLIPLIANDETELNDFISDVLPLFKTSDANVRNDVSVEIKKYKEENPKDDKKDDKKDDLEAKLEAIQQELEANKRESFVRNTKSSILSKLKEKGVTDTDWAKALIDEIEIGDNFDVDSKVESFLSIYNKMKADYDQDTTPRSTKGGKGNYLDDVIGQAASFNKEQDLYS